MKNIISLLCLCLCLCVVACLASCTSDNTAEESSDVIASNALEQDVIVQNVSGMVAELTFEEMLGKSHIAAKGEITGISRSFAVKPVNGGDASNFYEYELTLEDVYIGEKTLGDKLNIRVQGGQVDNIVTSCAETPELEVGTKVLAILTKAGKGSNLYVTDEDYYLIVGVNQGIFTADESKDSLKNAMGEDAGALSDMVTDIRKFASDYTPDYDPYETVMNNLDESLRDGRITQAEYDISKANFEKYAERVK